VACRVIHVDRRDRGIARLPRGFQFCPWLSKHHCGRPGRVRTDPSVNSDPDRVETRLGPLEFFDGYPNAETVDAVYDNLDFQRGVRAFLDSLPIASLYAMRAGLREVGAVNGTVGIFEELMDARTLFLTANTESVYAVTWLDLKDGPMVVESAPNTLGILDDFFFGHVTDLGNAGPDRGQGGKFLILPPGYEGEVPDGYYTATSRTFGNWLIWRGFLEDGDPQPAVANLKANTRIYPLAQRDDPPATEFVNLSGRSFNTIHANDLSFYEEVHAVIQEEPVDTLDPGVPRPAGGHRHRKGQTLCAGCPHDRAAHRRRCRGQRDGPRPRLQDPRSRVLPVRGQRLEDRLHRRQPRV
jgi:hypothetical protein